MHYKFCNLSLLTLFFAIFKSFGMVATKEILGSGELKDMVFISGRYGCKLSKSRFVVSIPDHVPIPSYYCDSTFGTRVVWHDLVCPPVLHTHYSPLYYILVQYRYGMVQLLCTSTNLYSKPWSRLHVSRWY